MSRPSFASLLASALLLGATGFACLEPAPPTSLELTLRAPPYPRPRCAKRIADRAEGARWIGEPVPRARVRFEPSGLERSADAEGRVVISGLADGRHRIEVSAPGYAPETGTVELRFGETRQLSLALRPCLDPGPAQLRVGFDREVSLRAYNRCGESWSDAKLTWTQREGPDLRAGISSWNATILRFRTRRLEELRTLPAEPQVLSFSPDEAGEYVFELTGHARDGSISRSQILVTSSNRASGINNVSLYERVTFLANKKGPWKWRIQDWPEGWSPTLEDADSRTPSITVTPPYPVRGAHVLSIQNQLPPYELFGVLAANWDATPRDCGRSECHAALQKGWEATRHALAWRRIVDGDQPEGARAAAEERCASCHSVGYDPSSPNGGYDDAAMARSLSFPAPPTAGTYAALPRTVKEVSNVFCLACHGPARVYPPQLLQLGRFQVGVCAQCHDRLPEQDLVAQWRTSRMARLRDQADGPARQPGCKGCHSAQGAYATHFKLLRTPSDETAGINCCDPISPITCQTCHSPMRRDGDGQLFRRDSVRTASGLDLVGVGAGALCATCHNTGHDPRAPSTLALRLAPHAPQADLSSGRAGFELPAPDLPPLEGTACAAAAKNGCVTCHMDVGPPAGDPGHRRVGAHTFRMRSSEGVVNARPCQACHDAARTSFEVRALDDYDGDGRIESALDEVRGLRALLRDRLEAKIAARGYLGCAGSGQSGRSVARSAAGTIAVLDADGIDLGDCDRNGRIDHTEQSFHFPDADLLLHQAAYNLLLCERDGSEGLHNHPYTIKLLQRTIVALTAGKGLPRFQIRR